MFGLYSTGCNIVSPYSLVGGLVATKDVCCMVAPHKVSSGIPNKLYKYFLKDFYVALTSMQNGKFSSMDGLP